VAPGEMEALIAAAQAAQRPAPSPPAWSWEDAARATWDVYARSASAASTEHARPSPRPLRRPAGATGAAGIDGLEPQ
jgi:hypothetical protein